MTRPRPEGFTCAICEERKEYRWPGSIQTWPVQPICTYCENLWKPAVVSGGSHMDNRLTQQIGALSHAIRCISNRIEHEGPHANTRL